MRYAISIIPILFLVMLFAAGCSSDKTKLRVINAGSLMVPFAEMEEAFEAEHPDVDVLIEGHGSIQVIRHVTELYAEADVIAVADHSLLPMMMYQTPMPETDEPYADWLVKFATNRLGIAYTPSSKYADEVNSENWYEVLARPDVALGVSDPRFDSCGYRSLMLCQLAELYYHDDQIFEGVLGEFSPRITVEEVNGQHVITVPEILRPKKVSVRGSSVALLSTIESGDIDYAFQYESVSRQYGLEFIELPVEIDLSSNEYQDSYERVQCKLAFQRFASVVPVFDGESIVYAMTIPENSEHPELAAEFIEFVLGPEGSAVLARMHQPALVPPTVDHRGNIPEVLTGLIEEY